MNTVINVAFVCSVADNQGNINTIKNNIDVVDVANKLMLKKLIKANLLKMVMSLIRPTVFDS